MELATLGIAVDSRQVRAAESDLKKLSDTGAHTERSLDGVGAAGKEAARGSDATARSSRDATRALDQHDNAAKRLTASVRYFAAASLAAGAAAATWMLSMSRSMDATNKMAEQIGVTTEALTGMRFATQQFASISDQQFDMSMRRMTRRIEEAAQGGGAAKGAIEGLGLSAQELARLSPDRQMLAIADAMQRTESQARRLQYTMALFDTEGMPLVAALQQGSAAFKENIELAQRYGVVLTTEAANAASSFQTEIDRLHSIMSGFSMDLANQVLPTLNQFVRNAIEAATQVDGLHTEVKDLAKDATFKEWFDAALVGLARVADVAVFVAKSVGTVGLAFQAAAADVQAGLAWLAKPNAADKLLLPAEEYNRLVEEYEAAMGRQQTTVQRFNTSLDELLTYQGNRFEQAALRAINTITVTSDKITTVDLTVGGGSAGASEEQLKKLTEWMGRLATPTEKLEETLAKARAELGPLFSPEIERRIRAQFAAQQAGNKVMTEAQRIAQAFTRERQHALRTQFSAISAIQDEAQAIEDQVALFGLSKAAIQDLTIARLEEQAAMLRGFDGSQEQVDAIEREIEARQRLRTAIGSLEQKEAERQAWEDWSRDVEQIFQQVGQSLTDAIFEGGKSARDLVKDLFKTLTLRVLVQPVMTGLQGLFMGAGPAGVANAAGAGGGMMGNASSLFSMFGGNSMGMGISNALTNLSSSSMLAGTGVGNWMTGVAGNVAGMSNLALGGAGLLGGLGAGLLFDNKGYSSAGGGLGATAGMVLGGPVGAIAGSLLGGALGSLFGDDEPKTRHAQMAHAELMGDGRMHVSTRDSRQSEEVQIAAAKYAEESIKAAQGLFDQIGIDAEFTRFMTLMESSILGDKQGVGSSGTIRIGDLEHEIGLAVESSWTKHGFGGWSDAEMFPRLQTDIQLTLLEAFQVAGDQLPSVLSGMLEGVDIRSLGAEQAQALAQEFAAVVEQVSSLQAALEQLPFANLRDLSFDAAAGLIAAAGGLDNLNAGMSSYFQNFYSEAEQLDWATQQIGAAFGELGLALPDVTQGAEAAKAEYRSLVESLDVTTEEGQRAYATLMTLSGGFAELVTGMDELNNAVVETARSAADIARERESLERQLLALQGNTTELRRRELTAIDESNRSLQEAIWSMEDYQASLAEEAQITAQREGLETQLQQALGDTTELRRRELEALDETARGLQQAIWGIQDAQNALTTSFNALQQQTRAQIAELQQSFGRTDTVYRALQQAGNAAKRQLEQTFAATDRIYNAARDAAQTAQSELQSIFDSLSGHIRDLRGEVDSTARMQYDQARSVISTALVTGQLPQSANLDEALRIAREGVANQTYASRFDQDQAYIRLANEMEALKDIAEPELDVATRTLNQIEKQYNALRGIADVSDASLDTLRGQLSAAIATEVAARRQVERIDDQLAQAAEQMNALRGIEDLSGLSFDALKEQLGIAISTEEAARAQIGVLEADLEVARGQYEALMGIKSGVEAFPAALDRLGAAIRAGQAAAAEAARRAADASRDQRYYEAKLDQLRRENPNYGGTDWTTATVSDLVAVFLKEGMTPERHYKLHGRYEGLSYAVGTSYVPYDMRANIHQGEIIIDPRSSDILRRYGIEVQGTGDKALERRMESVEGELVKTNQYLYQIAKETKRTALNTEDTATAVGAHSESEGLVVVY